jgi:hypothetical protein
MRGRKPPSKPRDQYLIATTKGEVSEISLSVGADGSIQFETDMVDARLETTYARPKKPKVVHRINVEPDKMYLNANMGLIANYGIVFAVDTNTREINGHRVSMTAVVQLLPDRGDGELPMEPLCFVEFLDVQSRPEQLGWIVAAKNITRAPQYQSVAKIGFVVDCDETNIPAYNVRTLPVYRQNLLPQRVTLIYATADTGPECLANALIKYADYTRRSLLDAIASGRVPMNAQRVPAGRGYGYAGVRTVTAQKLPDAVRGKQSELAAYRLTFHTPQVG